MKTTPKRFIAGAMAAALVFAACGGDDDDDAGDDTTDDAGDDAGDDSGDSGSSGDGGLPSGDVRVEAASADVPVTTWLMADGIDEQAAQQYWMLALRTGGSFVAPARDWP